MSSPSYTEDLLEKLRALPEDKLAEVIDFVEFLRDKQLRTGATLEERLRIAADARLLVLPEKGATRSSTTDKPPIVVPGTPASKIVVDDRR